MEIKAYKKDFSKLGFRMLAVAVIIYGVQMISHGIVLNINEDWINNMNIMLAAGMLPMYAVGFPAAFLLMGRGSGRETIEKHNMKPGHLVLAFLMSYTLLMAGNIVGLAFTAGLGFIKGEPVTNAMVEVLGDGNVWISAIYMVLFAPVYEEYLFRKLICDRVVKYGQGMTIMISGLMFGLFHSNFNQFFYAFTIGCFFAFIYVKTGRVIYTIILHMAVNFLGSVVGGLMIQNIDPENVTVSGMIVSSVYVLCIFSVVIAGAVLFLANLSKLKAAPGEITIPKGSRFNTAIMNAGMFLFCLVFVASMVYQAFCI